MFSEESGEEETKGHGQTKFLTKRPLPFRSEKTDVFFKKLDDLAMNEKKTSISPSSLGMLGGIQESSPSIAVANPGFPWEKLDQELWAFPAVQSGAASSSAAANKGKHPKSINACFKWNEGTCSFRPCKSSLLQSKGQSWSLSFWSSHKQEDSSLIQFNP